MPLMSCPSPLPLVGYDEISPLSLPDWDARIRLFESAFLFQEAAWLRFLEESQGVTVRGLRLRHSADAVAGYFCAAETRKGPFRLLGAPLQGWTTTFMGPIVNTLHADSFLTILEQYCGAHRVHYIELCNPILPAAAMQARGYECDPDVTFRVAIDNEDVMWQRLESKSCRHAIRRARSHGLRVEPTDDPAVVDEYYSQLQEVFQRQGLVPTYDHDRVRTLWNYLHPASRLLALQVWHHDEVIASGLFPFDDRGLYFWGGASRIRAYSLYPNELLQWHAMLFALERGIPHYYMGGGGTFKKKFGGVPVPVERWFKAFSPLARAGRIIFKQAFRTKQRLLGAFARFAAHPPRRPTVFM